MSRAPLDVDRDVPVLIVKLGRYPLEHGPVGAVRTLGRLGVPVYAITEDRFTPTALSRHLRGRFVWPTTGLEEAGWLLDGLRTIGRRLGRPAIAVATDDEAAVFIAEHAEELREHFVVPRVDPGLPRRLASKRGLYELCRAHGIPAPATVFPGSADELREAVGRIAFPVVVKNSEPWVRRSAPAVSHTTLASTPGELLELARRWPAAAEYLVQEYVPRERAQDWFVHFYCDAESTCLVGFSGVKVRSWPPDFGVTTFGCVAANPELVELTAEFCEKIGYCGVGDLDWRFDRRDGRYKLVDFNPRVGAQFRLFETDSGVDVIRALHLDLTGRRVPAGRQVDGSRLIVENLDAAAVLAYRRDGRFPRAEGRRGATKLAWFAVDDPLPFVAMSARHGGHVVTRMGRAAGRSLSRHRVTREG